MCLLDKRFRPYMQCFAKTARGNEAYSQRESPEAAITCCDTTVCKFTF
jgi:hypothetical protein